MDAIPRKRRQLISKRRGECPRFRGQLKVSLSFYQRKNFSFSILGGLNYHAGMIISEPKGKSEETKPIVEDK